MVCWSCWSATGWQELRRKFDDCEDCHWYQWGQTGHGRRKKSPMPRIVVKEEAKEEKKGQSGAWEQKKVTHAPN